MHLLRPVFPILTACLLTLLTIEAGAADLYQTARTDCPGSANLNVYNGPLGEILDVKIERTARRSSNFFRDFVGSPLELWTIDIVARGGTRSASIVVEDQPGAATIAENVRKAATVEWIGPCYIGFRVNGEDVMASMTTMLNGNDWVRIAR